MKRAQIVERNRGHWDFEVQHPVAPPSALEQSGAMPRNFGVTTRRLRFTRSSSRNERECGANEAHEESGGEALAGTTDRVLRSSQARVSSSVREAPKSLEIFRDHISAIVTDVDESGQGFLSPEVQKVTSSTASAENQPQQKGENNDRGKENVDPLGGASSGSPLPDWFTRRPLQDITNVLAAGLGDDQQPQPKKKLKKKAGAAAAQPAFPSLSETPTRRKDATTVIQQPKCSSFATPKQFSNLGKNFR